LHAHLINILFALTAPVIVHYFVGVSKNYIAIIYRQAPMRI